MIIGNDDVVYKAAVTITPDEARVYIGMMEHSFKTRFDNHKVSFKPCKHSLDTVLSPLLAEVSHDKEKNEMRGERPLPASEKFPIVHALAFP